MAFHVDNKRGSSKDFDQAPDALHCLPPRQVINSLFSFLVSTANTERKAPEVVSHSRFSLEFDRGL